MLASASSLVPTLDAIAVRESRLRSQGRLEGAAARRRERALLRAAKRGDARAFEALFRAHWAPAHRAAWLVLHDAAAAEDVVQEAFLAAVRALDRFDARRPFGPWLHRIVVNRAIDAARSRALRRETVAWEVPDPAAARAGGEDGRATGIEAALAALSPQHRAVVVLRFVLDYTPGEIARLLDLPRGTVNSRLRRALDRMEAVLREEAAR